MWSVGPVGFAVPVLLWGLLALPLLWWLLRAVPPAPVRRRFPGVALLLGLRDDKPEADKTPWWLLLLRMLAIGAVIIGFAWPLASAITHSMSLLDCAIWGGVALVVQVLTFMISSAALKQLPQRITQGELAAGIFSAGCSITVGMLNAACMSY